MSQILSFAPALLGFLIVIQAGLNRKIASHWSLSSATLLNSVVLLLLATLYWFSSRGHENLQVKNLSYWFFFPGIIGFCLVVGGPWFVARWGAVHTFVLIVSAQLLASLIWDWKVENISISNSRLVGVFITWLGVLVTTWSSKR